MKSRADMMILAEGRGVTFGDVPPEERADGVVVHVSEPRECRLGIAMSGCWKGLPFLLFPDGSARIALGFERKSGGGEWEKVSLEDVLDVWDEEYRKR